MRNEETLAQLIISLMGENNNKTNKQKSRSVILLQRKGFARTLRCVLCVCRLSPHAITHPLPVMARAVLVQNQCLCVPSQKRQVFVHVYCWDVFVRPDRRKGN